MFKDILRQLLKESENIIRIFPLKGYQHKKEAERANTLSLKRPFQQLSSVRNIFADYLFLFCVFIGVFVSFGSL